MMSRNYDASIVRWFDCVARNSHRFNSARVCMDCGAEQRGPLVQIRGGSLPRREKPKAK